MNTRTQTPRTPDTLNAVWRRGLLFAGVMCFAMAASAQPYQPHVIWDRSGLTDSSAYGYKVLPLGDQNDDGFADWAVYAQGNGGGWHGSRHSYLEFFHGGQNPSTEPYFTYHEDSTLYDPLWYPDPAGDLNGDGYQDWMLWLWPRSHPPFGPNLFFYGGSENDSTPAWEWNRLNGHGLYAIGDFNGDGYDDLYDYDFYADVGRMYNGGSPMDTITDWVIYQPPPGINQTIPYAVGDFTGDGASDFICYNPNPPYNLAIFLGGADPDTVPAYLWTNMPWPLGGVKSITGNDGDEWLAAAVNGTNVFYGQDPLQPTPNTFLSSEAAGYAVSAGDFNHDGYNDVILYTPTTGGNMFGALTLHLGHPWIYPNPAFEIQGSWPDGLIGIYTAAGLGDVNGDGIDDIAIGAWDDFAYLGWRGRCVILAGDTSLMVSADEPGPELPRQFTVSVYPNPFNAQTILSLDIPFGVEQMELSVVNVLGQRVSSQRIPVTPGRFEYRYDGRELASGVYVLRVDAGKWRGMQKVVVLK